MKLTGRHARLRLRLEPAEIALLSHLFDELETLLDGVEEDPVLARLNPAAYPDDVAAEDEYRELTATSLRAERDERIAACRADLAADGNVDLGERDAAHRWIQVLNDLRLALGTRLGVTEDDDASDIDLTEPGAQPRVVYYWLTAVQDGIVHELMR